MGRACRDDLPDGESEIFFARGLDDPNHAEMAREIGLCAQALWRAGRPASETTSRKIDQLIHLTGKIRQSDLGLKRRGSSSISHSIEINGHRYLFPVPHPALLRG
jgi:hypothetical protein